MSSRSQNRAPLIFSLILIPPIIALSASALPAADSDVWTTHSGADPTAVGVPFTITVGYGNDGPDPATSAFINSYFTVPMGMDVFIADLFNGSGAIYFSIQASAEGTDTLGNAPLLFWDDFLCEELLFQLQRDDGDPEANPVEGLDPGVSASFSYDVVIPMESPNTGTVEILEPASLVQTWTPSMSSLGFIQQAAALNTYGRGGCELLVGGPENDICEFIDENCFGARISLLDQPIDAEWELVNDGSANPTFGCETFIDFTPGNIAVVRRGDCEFGVKAFNAEQAGATGVIIVNNGLCGDLPSSDQCIISMNSGALGGLVSIPAIMLAQADGDPVIDTMVGGELVRGVFGGASQLGASGFAFLTEVGDTDPSPENDESRWIQSIYGVGCGYDLDPATLSYTSSGGGGQVGWSTATGCYWTGSTQAPWVSLTPPLNGTGDGTIDYQVEPNAGPGRSAVVRVANQAHIVTQDSGNGCTYAIDPIQTSYPHLGGEGSTTISTQTGCEWSVLASEPWISLASPDTGSGNATVIFSVSPNYGNHRSGAVLVADRIHQITQSAAPFFSDGFETGDTSGWDGISR